MSHAGIARIRSDSGSAEWTDAQTPSNRLEDLLSMTAWRLKDPVGMDCICMHTFLPHLLDDPDGVVVDLGANRGQFSRRIASRYGCEVYAVEPDPRLTSAFPNDERISVCNVCIAGETGTTVLSLPPSRDARLVEFGESGDDAVQVEGITFEEFVQRLGLPRIALLKIDIERAELHLMEKTSREVLRRAKQITVEFHDWKYDEDRPRVDAVIDRMERIGFWYLPFSFNRGDVLFVSRDSLSVWGFLYLRYIVRYVRGAKRVVGRWAAGT